MAKAKAGQEIIITNPMSICYGIGDTFVVLSERAKCVEIPMFNSSMLVGDSEYEVHESKTEQ